MRLVSRTPSVEHGEGGALAATLIGTVAKDPLAPVADGCDCRTEGCEPVWPLCCADIGKACMGETNASLMQLAHRQPFCLLQLERLVTAHTKIVNRKSYNVRIPSNDRNDDKRQRRAIGKASSFAKEYQKI